MAFFLADKLSEYSWNLKDIPTNPSIFEELKLKDQIKHYDQDLRDLSKVKSIISNEKPDFIFHLAAQPLVLESYINPVDTISSNVMGTTNVLIFKNFRK